MLPRRKKTLIFNLFMLFMLSSCKNKLVNEHIYIDNIDELETKKYMTDIKFIIEYDPSFNNNFIYNKAIVSVEIINLYADGVMIRGIENMVDVEGYNYFPDYITEYEEKNITRKTMKARYGNKEWVLFSVPHGNISKIKTYYIPWKTKKLRIIYRILFPWDKFSEQKEALLLIR